jgi:hypothetical protein
MISSRYLFDIEIKAMIATHSTFPAWAEPISRILVLEPRQALGPGTISC